MRGRTPNSKVQEFGVRPRISKLEDAGCCVQPRQLLKRMENDGYLQSEGLSSRRNIESEFTPCSI